jgi:hypothetical protein
VGLCNIFVLGPGERVFAQGSSIQLTLKPFTIRADGIKNDREAHQYVAQVAGVVRSIEAASVVGKTLIAAIRSYRNPVLVFPLVKANDGDEDTPFAWVSPRCGLYPVVMSYSPLFGQRLHKHLGGDPQNFAHVFNPHEVFVHELVHVARAASGNFGKMGDDEEELAVMIANMYSVEMNRPPITNYEDMAPVAKADVAAFSRSFCDDYAEMIGTFCRQNRNLALELSNAKTAFNPLRTYIDENL